jgi:hypothetical protein
MPDAQPYQVVDFTNSGVYLIVAFEGTAAGVWRVDPGSGVMIKVSDGYYTPSGAAWIGVVDPRDPNPQRSAMSGMPAPDRIDRRDDAGQTTTWFYEPGHAVSWVAFAGSPAAMVVSTFRQDLNSSPPTEPEVAFWLVDSPGHSTRLTSDSTYFLSGFNSAIADTHGIWIGGDGLHFIQRGGAIVRVFDSSVYPANGRDRA